MAEQGTSHLPDYLTRMTTILKKTHDLVQFKENKSNTIFIHEKKKLLQFLEDEKKEIKHLQRTEFKTFEEYFLETMIINQITQWLQIYYQ
jgi:hypothetical protein